MVKQNWSFTSEEKLRILNLHESATKKLYLSEQSTRRKSWRLCGYIIFEQGGKYYTQNSEGVTMEVPKLSETQGVIQKKQLVLNEPTKSGIALGEDFDMYSPCTNKKPQMYYGMDDLFVYFDDLETNLPYFGIIGFTGKVATGTDDFVGTEIPKDRDGVLVKFKKSRSKSFIIEVSPAMVGKPVSSAAEEPKKEKPKLINLSIDSPFIFDDVILTPEAETRFKNFMKELKQNYDGIKGNVEVITSASIDGDPNTKLKNGMTRREYDLELSRRRANEIVRRLESESGVSSLNFIPKGIGQTSQYGPSWPEAKNPVETAPNRKLIINLPTIEKTN